MRYDFVSFRDRCGLDVESIIHAIRDCGFSNLIWKSVVPRSA